MTSAQMSKLVPGDQCQCGVEVALDAGVEGRHEPDPIDGQTLGGSDTRNQLRLQSIEVHHERVVVSHPT